MRGKGPRGHSARDCAGDLFVTVAFVGMAAVILGANSLLTEAMSSSKYPVLSVGLRNTLREAAYGGPTPMRATPISQRRNSESEQ